MQKLLSADEYAGLKPSYDPGSMFPSEISEDQIRELLGVSEKAALLSRLRGNTEQSLLDIGSGAGGFLLAGRDLGFRVLGIEPSATHSELARSRLQLPVKTGYFRPQEFAEQFDVVLVSHVIEHIYHPKGFLRDVLEVVKPGGTLIVITPNSESLSARVTRRYWSMLKPIDHVSMLGKRSLTLCCPSGASVRSLESHEWPGEFAAHLLSASKQLVMPSLSNHSATLQHKVTAQKETIGSGFRAFLAIISLPFYLLGGALDRRSCVTALFQKDG